MLIEQKKLLYTNPDAIFDSIDVNKIKKHLDENNVLDFVRSTGFFFTKDAVKTHKELSFSHSQYNK